MITVTSVVGNIRSNRKLGEILESFRQAKSKTKKVERVLLSRMEARRSRIRRTSDMGTDLAISLEDGAGLKDGDVLLLEENRIVVVEHEPEDVIGFKIIAAGLPAEQKVIVALKLGHIIGNLHRPFCTKDETVYVPIQSEAEVENIRKIMGPITDFLDIRRERMVFEPDEGIRIHAH